MENISLWNIKRLATESGMSESFWRKRVTDGSVAALKVGKRSVRIPDAEVRKFMKKRAHAESQVPDGVGSCTQTEGGEP